MAEERVTETGTVLHVLVVGGSDCDARAVSQAIREGGYEPVCERVADEAEMRAALRRQEWQAIVSGCGRRPFDARDALRVLGESGRDLPFLVVSGAVGEEKVAELIRAGAHDFISSGNLTRLVPAIERERRAAAEREARRRAEAALRESERRSRLFFDESPIGAVLTGLDYRFLRVNAALCRTLGYSEAELTAMRFTEITHPDHRAADLENVQRLAAGEVEQYVTEKRYLRRDGSALWGRATVRLVKDSAGKPLSFIAMVEDVTDLRRSTDALRDSQQMLRNVLDSFPGVVFWKDRHSVYLGCNRTLAHIAGLSDPAEIVGKTDYDLPWADTKADVYRAGDRAVLESGRPVLGVIERQIQADGRLAWFDTSKIPLFDAENQVCAVLGISGDITAQKRAKEQLRAADEQVLHSEVERKRFYREVIRAVTHDKLHLVDASEVPLEGRPVLDVPLQDGPAHRALRAELRELCASVGASPEVTEDIVLMVGEATINAVKHAGGGRLTVHMTPGRIIARVSDTGTGIATEHLAGALLVPGFSTEISLGMGYTLMMELADRIWLATGREGTLVQLAKWLRPAEHAEPEFPAAWARL